MDQTHNEQAQKSFATNSVFVEIHKKTPIAVQNSAESMHVKTLKLTTLKMEA